MNIIDELTEYFRKFPGIGPRQAKRFVYYLLKQDKSNLVRFSEKILELKNSVKQCQQCFRFFTEFTKETDSKKCSICRNSNRDLETLMLVSTDTDFESVEKSGSFNGTYFILGGLVPILHKNPEQIIRLNALIKEVSNRASHHSLKEIIIALNASPEGEHTTEIIKISLKPLLSKKNIKISILGRGLSTGTEIEYSDPETLKNAFLNRN